MTFSQAGSPEFNQRLGEILDNLAQEVKKELPSHFIALVLAGGYGRGEGACVLRHGEKSLYNDLDLFLIVDTPMAVPESIRSITHGYEKQLGIEVDIGKPLTLKDIKSLPHQLMWQDLIDGHYVVLGDSDILTRHAPAFLTSPLPQVEALRLLLNRGSGLLQALMQSHLLSTDAQHNLPDADFIRRNRAKCMLALGDSLLISYGVYSSPLAKRIQALHTQAKAMSIPSMDRIQGLFDEAARFKVRPDSLPTEQPALPALIETAALWVEVLLHTEALRTKRQWSSLHAYAHDLFIREPEQHTAKRLLRNLVRNAQNKRLSFHYPRERLYRQLARLLDQPHPEQTAWMREAQEFLSVWRRYN